MKITKNYLKQVIKEELESVLREEDFLNEGIKDFVKSKFGKSESKTIRDLKNLYEKLKNDKRLPEKGFYNPKLQEIGKKLYDAYNRAEIIRITRDYEDTTDADENDYIKYATYPENYYKSSPEERKKAIENLIRTTKKLFVDNREPVFGGVVPGESTFYHFLEHALHGVTLKDARAAQEQARIRRENEWEVRKAAIGDPRDPKNYDLRYR